MLLARELSRSECFTLGPMACQALVISPKQALAKRNNFRPAVVKLAPALFALHQDAQATKVLEDAAAQYPDDDLLLSDLGNAYVRQGEIAKASTVLDRAVKANPDRTESHNLLGVITMKQGNRATAAREFREALRCQPDFAKAWDNGATARSAAGASRTGDSVAQSASRCRGATTSASCGE
jgi:Flp pilus assembly protein TadD